MLYTSTKQNIVLDYTHVQGRAKSRWVLSTFLCTLLEAFPKGDEALEFKSDRRVISRVSSPLLSYYPYSFLQTNSINFLEFQSSTTTDVHKFTNVLDHFLQW